MMIKATFNNISFIWWRLVSLLEEMGVPGEIHRPAASHWQTWSHNAVSRTPRHERDYRYVSDYSLAWFMLYSIYL